MCGGGEEGADGEDAVVGARSRNVVDFSWDLV